MRSGRDLPDRQDNNPPWFSPENKLDTLGDVKILCFQDAWPACEDSIWLMTCLKVAVQITLCFTNKSRGWKRPKISFSDLWELSYQYDVSHNEVGGVIDGKFHVEVCAGIGWPVERLRAPRVSAVLGKALSDTTSGRQETSKPKADQPNSYRGILQWKARACMIIAYSFFHRDGAVERKLHLKKCVVYLTTLHIVQE